MAHRHPLAAHPVAGVTSTNSFEIFLVCPPGLEALLAEEARSLGFSDARVVAGGVSFSGDWRDVWLCNLKLRGASRVLARIASFRASHLAQLDKRARDVPWADHLRPDVPVSIEASCSRSKIYHSGAAAERFARAVREELGAPVSDEAEVTLKARIDRDVVTLSLDTSGGLLHKRGAKQAMAKAPLRETMAALLLRACGFNGAEPVYDPMCGSGTFVIEAAEWAAGLAPGRNRSFAFEKLASFDAALWDSMKRTLPADADIALRFQGSDRDAGAVKAAIANAERAGMSTLTSFERKPIGACTPPAGPAGLVIVNPPYGARIGERKSLFGLYGALGGVLKDCFKGWRVGLVTSDKGLATATGLPFVDEPLAFLHGGLRVALYRTPALS
jgi:putative N6-adenine-specific DNA methylase